MVDCTGDNGKLSMVDDVFGGVWTEGIIERDGEEALGGSGEI